MSMSLLMCFIMCFTYVFKCKKLFDIWSDISYITQNLESCQEVIRMLLSPQASCLKTKKATSLPASHWKHFTLTFRGHFQGCLFVKATENQLHHIKSGKKTKVSRTVAHYQPINYKCPKDYDMQYMISYCCVALWRHHLHISGLHDADDWPKSAACNTFEVATWHSLISPTPPKHCLWRCWGRSKLWP